MCVGRGVLPFHPSGYMDKGLEEESGVSNAVSARQGPAGLDRGQDMDTLARRVPASLSAKSHARTFIAAEHPSQLSCG